MCFWLSSKLINYYLKNHDLRPASTKAVLEANVISNRNSSRFRGRGRGVGHGP